MSRFADYAPGSGGRPRTGTANDGCIRPAEVADLPALAAIAAEREGEPASTWLASLERVHERARAGSAFLLVASIGDDAVAYGKAERHPPSPDAPPNAAPAGWYLAGVVVRPAHRRRGIGSALTNARLDWIAGRAPTAYYFANARNQVSIDLHAALGFREITRDFHHPHARFEGGVGILFGCDVSGRSFLRTERLEFRLWRESDLEAALGLWGDPEVTRFIDARPGLSRDEVRDRLFREIATQREHEIQYWPIHLRGANDLVGCCGLKPRDPDNRIYELGVHLGWAYWGKGLAQEAGEAVVLHAFRDRGARALFAGHHPENKVSGVLLERLGFRWTHEELFPPTGLMHPSYRLDAPETES